MPKAETHDQKSKPFILLLEQSVGAAELLGQEFETCSF